MSKIQPLQPVRGTHDWIGLDYDRYYTLIARTETIMRRYQCKGVTTPIFENTGVFIKTLGDASDIVGKEMYTFLDKGGESITLRPEGTAAVVRALISNGLTQDLPFKVFYHGPMFRYERPQAGRTRQFHQFGMECIGTENPHSDVEVLHMASQIFKELGVIDKVVLELNTLGDKESREHYRAALVAYFSKYAKDLSEDSQRRLEANPLRILDSKNEGDKKISMNAPKLHAYLNDTSRTYFDQVCAGLSNVGVAYTLNQRLVRGLDYYNHTAFEFTTTHLGAQGTVLGGGRYNGLVASMGGPDLAGIGWAFGIERMLTLASLQATPSHPIAIIPLEEIFDDAAFILAQDLRAQGLDIDMAYAGNAGKRMKRADKVGASHAVILAGDEMTQQQYIVRNLSTREQQLVSHDSLLHTLKNLG